MIRDLEIDIDEISQVVGQGGESQIIVGHRLLVEEQGDNLPRLPSRARDDDGFARCIVLFVRRHRRGACLRGEPHNEAAGQDKKRRKGEKPWFAKLGLHCVLPRAPHLLPSLRQERIRDLVASSPSGPSRCEPHRTVSRSATSGCVPFPRRQSKPFARKIRIHIGLPAPKSPAKCP